MTEVKVKKAKVEKKYIALKCLATSEGQVKKGEEFTCSEKELAIFKKLKAV